MSTAVLERTREIGIRKAIGACERDILWQFRCGRHCMAPPSQQDGGPLIEAVYREAASGVERDDTSRTCTDQDASGIAA